ncbi:L-rhamnose mutarotase [Aquirufa ecclesiirivi]|uniref:L-rhamnose mutarotase n=1 Tax=Aquirufa ecclesiirivi TaxID=2715124 RepID=UPI0022A824DE|nr:L-rhamnose mutarotase [Aquirufa ecclesiirivi]MCZ2472306.1 L-rhamnose mutarotase [Aquirufa ecclesiirivi]
MQRKALKMFLLPGKEAEYKKRHDEIWPELAELLKSVGVQNYSIFLDPETLVLFAYLEAEDLSQLDHLPQLPIMQKWWAYMADIMESNPDHSPKSVEIPSVFYLA